MKLPINWLKEYVDPKLSTEALIDRLTMAGLEVEGVETVEGGAVLTIEITPNRPDCLNILGLAREIGAITGKTVKAPKIKAHKTVILKDLIQVESKKDCSRYIATVIRDVEIKPAPAGMIKHLSAAGIKGINNAVDITNFVLMETGQPLHAFDLDKLDGGRIIVRRARQGETLVTLDGVERKLDPGILVIADASRPVAIAGIMGGKATEITAATKNILLESAHFDMGLIRRSCRALGLRSDSSYRFERNVNFEGVLTGADRATDLLLALTGGCLFGRAQLSGKNTRKAVKIKVGSAAIEEVLGVKVTFPKAKAWLSRLGFKVTGREGALIVVPPSFRGDVAAQVDVIEEIARMIGFDRLPTALPKIKASNIIVDQRPRAVKDMIRRSLIAGGVDEIITVSMTNSKALAKTRLTDIPYVRVFNPLSQEQELMRPSMLPSLLQAAVTNINRGQKDLRFFEIGKRYFKEGEKETLGILLTGRRRQDWRVSRKETVEIFDIKGLLENIFQGLAITPTYETNRMKPLDAQCASAIMCDGKFLGSLGRVDRDVLQEWDIKNQEVYFGGLHLEEIYPLGQKTLKYQPISEFPAITRDVSLAVKKEIPYKRIEDVCRQHGGGVLKSVEFIEQYLGDKIQSGFKGIVFSCHYQSNDRTLREEEVSSVHESLLKALVHELAVIRR